MSRGAAPPASAAGLVELETLRSWESPGPDDASASVRPKRYRVVRLEGEVLAFAKADSSREHLAHEGRVLAALRAVECVPALLGQTDACIYTRYVEGTMLPEAMPEMGMRECLAAGRQVIAAVARIHRAGVVHADVKPWNFLYGRDRRVYAIDFEYAYLRREADLTPVLAVHHFNGLKSAGADWADTWFCLADLWRTSPRPLVRHGCAALAAAVAWVLYLAQTPQRVLRRVRRRLAERRERESVRRA